MNHILQVAFGANTVIKTAPLYQWDYGQVIRFVGLNLPSHFEAHFSNNQTSGTAITVIGENNEAAIPDSLLQTGLEIWAWVYLHDEVTDGETEYTARIPVKARAKRDGTEPTPEEQDAIATAIEALNDATAVLDDAIAHTETYRDQAEAYAIQSESWAIGGTGTRQGEDTDNAKYYRDQAEATAQRVTEAVDYFVDTTVPQAIQSVGDEGTAQIALVDAEGTAQIGAVGDAGTAQIALVGAEGTQQVGIVSGEGATQKGNVSAEGSAQIGNVRSEGNAQIGLVQSEGSTQIGYVESAGTTQVGNVNSAGTTQVGLVQSAGSAQIGLVQAEGTAQISAVGSAGTTQIGLVGDKGTEQIGLVQAEGATQIAAIEAKGEEVLSEIIDKAPVIVDTASGAIASFPDGSDAPIKQLTVAVNPVQDLHGYDNPWPAGGGKNKLPLRFYSGVGYNVDAGTVFDTATEYTNGVVSGNKITFAVGGWGRRCMLSDRLVSGESYYISMEVTSANLRFTWYTLDAEMKTVRKYEVTGSGTSKTVRNPVTMAENECYIAIYLGSSVQGDISFTEPQIEVGSTATAYAPYKNECPITGWTGANVGAAGKNLLDYSTQTDGYRLDGNGDLVASGNHAVSDYIRVAPEESYYFRNMIGSTSGYALAEYDAYKRLVRSQTFYGSGSQSKAVTMQASTKYIRVCYGKTHTDNPAVLSPVENTDFAPYIGTTYPITFPSEAGTVYGGTLTVNQDGTGTLKVDHVLWQPSDLSAIGAYAETINGYSCVSIVIAALKSYETRADIKCTHFPFLGNTEADVKPYGIVNRTASYYNVAFCAPALFTTVAEFRTWVTENNVQMWTPKAEPTTYTLTAEEMTTLLGQNNWWADTGDVEVEYRADTKLYIDNGSNWIPTALSNIIASSENDMVASRNYTAKELVIVNNRLYMVTANIASGGAITVGTNVTAITLSDIIKTLI